MAKIKNNNDERSRELVANCDHIEKEENNISQSEIEKLILTIRGEQVIIDQDVARLYNVTTKRLNQQANRNSARFPHNFRFVLTKAECDEVVAKCDHLQSLKYRPTLPYAFTEQGIGQLLNAPRTNLLHRLRMGCVDIRFRPCAKRQKPYRFNR